MFNLAIAAHSDHTRFVYGESCSVTEISATLTEADIKKLEHIIAVFYNAGKRDALAAITNQLEAAVWPD